jgi:hypothetical protein
MVQVCPAPHCLGSPVFCCSCCVTAIQHTAVPSGIVLCYTICSAVPYFSNLPDVVVAGADELEQALHWVLPQHASPWQVR